MKYKMVISDFDYTLFDGKTKVLPEGAVDVIRAYVKKGGRFHLCTGRMFMAILPYAKKIGLKGEIVCYNGSAIYDIESEKRLLHYPIGHEVSLDILEFCEKNGYIVQAYIDDTLYCEKPNSCVDFYVSYCGARTKYTGIKLSEYLKNNACEVTKLLMYVDPNASPMETMKELVKGRAVATTSMTQLIEFISVESGKDKGVMYLSEKYSIPLTEILAFGDQINDVPMLKVAGASAAVASSPKEVKDAATFVTSDPIDEGVTKLMIKLGLLD